MFWLWHISNAGEYLIHLAMVNIPNGCLLFIKNVVYFHIYFHLVHCAWFTISFGCTERKSSWFEAKRWFEQLLYRVFSISRWPVGYISKWVVRFDLLNKKKSETTHEFPKFSSSILLSVIISPLVKYLFAPLAIIGCFGLSFQLSMLSDILNIITLHSHCIYTYASV